MLSSKFRTIIIFLNLLATVVSKVFRAEELTSQCSGTLRVHEGTEDHKFNTSAESLGAGIKTKRVVMEGCGCYILYQGPRRTGRAYFVNKRGQHEIKLGRIRSVYKQECRQENKKNAALTYWVIGIVLAAVLVVGIGLVCVKKRREKMYAEVRTETV